VTRTVIVTPKDWRTGVRNTCSDCPLAKAIGRALRVKDREKITVTREVVLVRGADRYDADDLGYTHIGVFPPSVQEAIKAFDQSDEDFDFSRRLTFELELEPLKDHRDGVIQAARALVEQPTQAALKADLGVAWKKMKEEA
jgi:hypothetical protein